MLIAREHPRESSVRIPVVEHRWPVEVRIRTQLLGKCGPDLVEFFVDVGSCAVEAVTEPVDDRPAVPVADNWEVVAREEDPTQRGPLRWFVRIWHRLQHSLESMW